MIQTKVKSKKKIVAKKDLRSLRIDLMKLTTEHGQMTNDVDSDFDDDNDDWNGNVSFNEEDDEEDEDDQMNDGDQNDHKD